MDNVKNLHLWLGVADNALSLIDKDRVHLSFENSCRINTARHEIDDAKNLLPSISSSLSALTAENERLREALKKIASCNPLFNGDVVHVARSALASAEAVEKMP